MERNVDDHDLSTKTLVPIDDPSEVIEENNYTIEHTEPTVINMPDLSCEVDELPAKPKGKDTIADIADIPLPGEITEVPVVKVQPEEISDFMKDITTTEIEENTEDNLTDVSAMEKLEVSATEDDDKLVIATGENSKESTAESTKDNTIEPPETVEISSVDSVESTIVIETDSPPIVETDSPIVVTDNPIVITDSPIVVTDNPIEDTNNPIVSTDIPIIDSAISIVSPDTSIVSEEVTEINGTTTSITITTETTAVNSVNILEESLLKMEHDEVEILDDSFPDEVTQEIELESAMEQPEMEEHLEEDDDDDVLEVEEGKTVTQITDDDGQVYYVQGNMLVMAEDEEDNYQEAENIEVYITNDEEEQETVYQSKPPTASLGKQPNTMPGHLIGRNVQQPTKDSRENGKPAPKPRLGVKIPYRNLTSQIVSKQDIAKVIMQRSQRHAGKLVASGGNTIFAKKLTKRLASRIIPETEKKVAKITQKSKSNSDLENEDLLAILEGNEETTITVTKIPIVASTSAKTRVLTAEMEREMALKQLRAIDSDDDEDMKGLQSLIKQEKKESKVATTGREKEFVRKAGREVKEKPVIVQVPVKRKEPEKSIKTTSSNKDPKTIIKDVNNDSTSTPTKTTITNSKERQATPLRKRGNKTTTATKITQIDELNDEQEQDIKNKVEDEYALSLSPTPEIKTMLRSPKRKDKEAAAVVEPEPSFVAKTVLKTYARKRKASSTEGMATFCNVEEEDEELYEIGEIKKGKREEKVVEEVSDEDVKEIKIEDDKDLKSGEKKSTEKELKSGEKKSTEKELKADKKELRGDEKKSDEKKSGDKKDLRGDEKKSGDKKDLKSEENKSGDKKELKSDEKKSGDKKDLKSVEKKDFQKKELKSDKKNEVTASKSDLKSGKVGEVKTDPKIPKIDTKTPKSATTDDKSSEKDSPTKKLTRNTDTNKTITKNVDKDKVLTKKDDKDTKTVVETPTTKSLDKVVKETPTKNSDLKEITTTKTDSGKIDSGKLETGLKTPKNEQTQLGLTYVTKSSRVIKKKVIWDPDNSATVLPKFAATPAKKDKLSLHGVNVERKSVEEQQKIGGKKGDNETTEKVEDTKRKVDDTKKKKIDEKDESMEDSNDDDDTEEVATTTKSVKKFTNTTESSKKVTPEIVDNSKSTKKATESPKKTTKLADSAKKNLDSSSTDLDAEEKDSVTSSLDLNGSTSTTTTDNTATPTKTRRKLNEVAKLLKDEGAINMLYSLKSDESSSSSSTVRLARRNNADFRGKASDIYDDLTSGAIDSVSPKALRKKEQQPQGPAPMSKYKRTMMLQREQQQQQQQQQLQLQQQAGGLKMARKKSGDSCKSSKSSRAGSPGTTGGGEGGKSAAGGAADASRIIRRRSSSSYSSADDEEIEDYDSCNSELQAPITGDLSTTSAEESQSNKSPTSQQSSTITEPQSPNTTTTTTSTERSSPTTTEPQQSSKTTEQQQQPLEESTTSPILTTTRSKTTTRKQLQLQASSPTTTTTTATRRKLDSTSSNDSNNKKPRVAKSKMSSSPGKVEKLELTAKEKEMISSEMSTTFNKLVKDGDGEKEEEEEDEDEEMEVDEDEESQLEIQSEPVVEKVHSEGDCVRVTYNGNMYSVVMVESLTGKGNKGKGKEKFDGSFNLEILTHLTTVLTELETNDKCHVVLFTSATSTFCTGIRFRSLWNKDERTALRHCTEMAFIIRKFLTVLAKFSKPIIAGVHGDCSGLGVTMLPLFDVVLATDTATFSTQGCRLGCLVEGSSLLTLAHLKTTTLSYELLLTPGKLFAEQALRSGLVSKVIWPINYRKESLEIVKTMSSQSLEYLKSTKRLTRQQSLSATIDMIKSETDTLIKQWTSVDCQKKFHQHKH